MRIKLPEIMARIGATKEEMAVLLWPDAGQQTRRVLIGRWLKRPVISVRLDQLKALKDRAGTNDINDLIEFSDERISTH